VDNFQTAYRRARQRFGEAWVLRSNDEQAEAVSKELRALKEERVATPADHTEEPR